ncbi:hypothetical protein [uncultured Ilyobacter sp.]|jgi:hypothetical protein|uniref:hypothetical protein n=1 Tax=uncultured Ilyobacter sp. TaxID=544433 RepID=UPI0029C0B86F|nr:hypothetical protein [uncultured Ilyobacter sp.]
MVLNVNLPKNFNGEAKILYLRKNNNLFLAGYGCYNSNLERCRKCSLQSFKKGDILDIGIDDIKNTEENGCGEMSNPYFSLKFDLGNIEGIRFY